MVWNPNFGTFNDFAQLDLFGLGWLVAIVFSVVIMALITREVSKWKIMFLPVLVLVDKAGVPIGVGGGIILYSIAILMFAIEINSFQIIGRAVSGVRNTIGAEAILDRFTKRREKLKSFDYSDKDIKKLPFWQRRKVKRMKKEAKKIKGREKEKEKGKILSRVQTEGEYWAKWREEQRKKNENT